MKVKVESSKGLQRKIKVSIPAEDIQKAIDKRLGEIAPNVKLKGFRPGKVPAHVIKEQYGGSVRAEVFEDTINSSFRYAVEKEHFHVAGQPNIEPSAMNEGEPLEYLATFEVFPEFKLASFEGVKFENPVVKISDADIDKIVEKLQLQHADWSEILEKAKKGDRVTVDVSAMLNKKVFEKASGEGISLIVGNPGTLPDLEKNLSGAKIGDEFTVKQKIPKDVEDKEIAGQTLVQSFSVKKVESPIPHEINEAFFEKVGIKEGTHDKLKEAIRKSMDQEVETALKSSNKQKVMEKFAELNKIEIPQALVKDEMQHLHDNAIEQTKVSRNQENVPEIPLENFRKQAERRILLGILLSEYIKANNLKVDKDRVNKMIASVASRYGEPEKVVQYYMENRQHMAEVESAVLEEQVVEKALEQFKLVDKPMTFDELMALSGRN